MNRIWIAAIGLLTALAAVKSASLPETIQTDFSCPGNGKYYDPKDCQMYYSCKDGKADHKYCGFGRAFDEISNDCKVKLWIFSNIDCSGVMAAENGGKPTASPHKASSKSDNNNGGGDSSSTTAKPNSAHITTYSTSIGLLLLTLVSLLS